ncbi:MAG: tetratricopeptide repeat protein [Ramlibacter sp.]
MGLLDWLKKPPVASEEKSRAQPDQATRGNVLRQRGNAFLAQGNLDAASASYREAIAANPQDANAHLNLGFVLSEQHRYSEAREALERSLGIDPGQADAFYILGAMANAQGNAAGAIDNFARALDCKPDFEAVYRPFCQTLIEEGQTERARQVLEKAVVIFPAAADLHANLGNLHAAKGDAQRAIDCFRAALAIQANDAQVHSSLGNVLRKSNRLEEALASYQRVLSLNPDSADAINDHAIALGGLGRHEEAAASFRRALEIEPRHVQAMANLCAMLACLSRYEEAARVMARLVELEPEYPYAIGSLLGWQLHSCDWSQYESRVERVASAVMGRKKAIQPFMFLAASSSPAAMLQCARINSADAYPASARPLWTGQCYAHDRIRIAYLSADFRDHAIAYLAAGLFELHDRERFETVAISFGPESNGAMRQRLRRSFGRFVDVRTMGDREAASLIREMEIDIAVDLTGFTTYGRPAILAHRPAPVQVSYLGVPGSLGADHVDYILADRHVIPEGQQSHYAEKVVWLPDTYQVNDSQRRVAERTPSRTECGLPEGGFVFCCFNNNYKITPEVFDVWMRLLRRVDGSVLWLLEDNVVASRYLRAEALRRGVAPDRLVFAPRMELEDHLARHRLADLFLDTLPYNAHTTASDALWAGLPLVTCMGNAFPGRVAASLLNAVGLPELVTHSLDDYEALSLKLATAPDLLSGIRGKLWRNRTEFPLFDTRRFCAHIEAAYVLMWERSQRGEAPASFEVPALDRS